MPTTKLIAKIKKIDISNKVFSDNWNQSISIILSDIELNDENLVAVRKFRPNEEIYVAFESLQLSMMDPLEKDVSEVLEEEEVPQEDLFVMDYDQELLEGDKVVKKFEL
ncbi:hypothetical protein SAMN05660297_02829 [Natronincola peptidivorans]|uniref:Uncharacterized protein n=1 Tax=Natronincola peptidivorans TaxID=426128 RepID=A0A1I0FJS1_9FIRM|nr:hypothetical protein [Natronincola peptidivorans]SET58491.1 hypothetical protein SAMN05660297_02829 [Natronincola peptidivorans]